MDIGKAFSYVFEDEQWISKVLIGGLLIWIPIVNFAVFGYMIKVAQNVAQGNPRPLPEWGEFGDHFGSLVSKRAQPIQFRWYVRHLSSFSCAQEKRLHESGRQGCCCFKSNRASDRTNVRV